MSTTTKHHILPLKLYLTVGAALFILTGITVGVAQIHLGPFNLVVALLIAVIKATLVVLFFMHLWWDSKFYMLVFVASIFFLGLFIVLTLFDTMRRGDLYEEVGRPIKENAAMYDSLAVKHDSGHKTPAGH